MCSEYIRTSLLKGSACTVLGHSRVRRRKACQSCSYIACISNVYQNNVALIGHKRVDLEWDISSAHGIPPAMWYQDIDSPKTRCRHRTFGSDVRSEREKNPKNPPKKYWFIILSFLCISSTLQRGTTSYEVLSTEPIRTAAYVVSCPHGNNL